MAAMDRIAELEKQLKAITQERDELQADVEKLCLQSNPSLWSSSKGMSERLAHATAEANRYRSALSTAEAERDNLRESSGQLRAANLELDRQLQDRSQRCNLLENEVAFLQGAHQQATAARDAATQQLQALQARCDGTVAELVAAQALVAQLQHAADELRADAAAAHVAAEDAKAQVSTDLRLLAELRDAQESARQLEDSNSKLKAQLAEVQAEASHTHKLLKQAHKIEDQLSSQVKGLQAALGVAKQGGDVAGLCLSTDGAAGAAASDGPSQGQLHATAANERGDTVRAHAAASPSPSPRGTRNGHSDDQQQQQQLALLLGEVQQLQARLAERELALVQVRAELEQERTVNQDEQEQLVLLRSMVHDFKVKLAQATQEKVEALMRMATLGETMAQAQHAERSRRPSKDGQQLSRSPGVNATLSSSPRSSMVAPARSAPTPIPLPSGHPHGAAGSAAGAAAAAEEQRASAASLAANAAATSAVLEAAEGRSKRLQSVLERLRLQLAAIDRVASHASRHLTQLRSSGTVLWSEADTARKWTAMSDLAKVTEDCARLRADAGLPPLVSASASQDANLPPPAAHGQVDEEGDADSLHCTRETVGVQRRVAAALLGTIDFAVQSLEHYSHQSAMCSVNQY